MLSKKRLERITQVAKRRQQGVVVFQDIYDPHNAAAVLRTADAFGIQKVYFIQPHFSARSVNQFMTLEEQQKFKDRILYDKNGAGFIFEKGGKFNPKKVGKTTSSSANKWLDFEVFDSTKKCFAKLKQQGYFIVAAVLDDKAKPLKEINFKKPKIALCFGNEHSGLSEEAVNLSDQHIYIPMRGFVQSLNLSVTAAILMYEMTRQRNNRPEFLLSKKEMQKLVNNWKQK